MRQQTRTIAIFIGLMCLVRFSLGAVGYVAPGFLMLELGALPDENLQMPYVVRVWAIRDMVITVLVVIATPATIVPLLIGCIVIDSVDILTAVLSGQSGAYTASETINLTMTAILALIPETIALVLILRNRRLSTIRQV